jgi:acyl-phosphate glycerol 3-phosphate acyltransferase
VTGTDLLAGALAYLLGSIPNAQLLVRRFRRRDLSASGSANVGALNAMRVARSRWLGVGVLLLDAGKGLAAVLLARWLGAQDGAGIVGVVAGHNYNAWLSIPRRRLAGGKGFAAAAGALALSWPLLIAVWVGAGLLAWAAFKLARGIDDEAPASLVATLALVPGAALLEGARGAVVMAAVAVLVVPKLVREVRDLLASKPTGA